MQTSLFNKIQYNWNFQLQISLYGSTEIVFTNANANGFLHTRFLFKLIWKLSDAHDFFIAGVRQTQLGKSLKKFEKLSSMHRQLRSESSAGRNWTCQKLSQLFRQLQFQLPRFFKLFSWNFFNFRIFVTRKVWNSQEDSCRKLFRRNLWNFLDEGLRRQLGSLKVILFWASLNPPPSLRTKKCQERKCTRRSFVNISARDKVQSQKFSSRRKFTKFSTIAAKFWKMERWRNLSRRP